MKMIAPPYTPQEKNEQGQGETDGALDEKIVDYSREITGGAQRTAVTGKRKGS